MIDTLNARAAQRQHLANLVAQYQGRVAVVPGFTGIKPLPPRRAQVDPDTRLTRRTRVIRPMHEGTWADKEGAKALEMEAQRAKLRAMADSL